MSLINERHIDADRAGDAQGGGNFPTLMDFLNKREVTVAPFSENNIAVSSAQFVLIDASLIAGTVALGTSSVESDGGVVAAALAGAIGTAATTNITDSLGNVTNLVEVREEDSHDSLLDSNGRKIYGLFQAASTVSDGDSIAASGSENVQVSFIIIAADGTLTLVSVNETVEIAVPKMYALRHLPTYHKAGSTAEAEVMEASAAPQEPVCRKYIVTADFAANEVITVSTGGGAGTGTSTPSNDTITSLGATAADFNNDNRTRARINGDQITKSTDVVWDSATTFHFAVALDVGDTFEMEVAV